MCTSVSQSVSPDGKGRNQRVLDLLYDAPPLQGEKEGFDPGERGKERTRCRIPERSGFTDGFHCLTSTFPILPRPEKRDEQVMHFTGHSADGQLPMAVV